MNVLNKIKSKKTKEPLRITQEVIRAQTQPSVRSKHQQNSKISSNLASGNLFIEKQPAFRSHNEKVKQLVESELEQATLSEYLVKKDKRTVISRIGGSDHLKEEDFKFNFCLKVKKGYTIGSICLLEGELVTSKQGKQERRRKISASCGLETIPFPEGISKVFLTKITYISQDELVFVGEDIIKFIQKGQSKKN